MSSGLLYLFTKLAALILASAYRYIDGGFLADKAVILTVLSFSCVFVLEFLLRERFNDKLIFTLAAAASAVALVMLSQGELFSLLLIVTVEPLDVWVSKKLKSEPLFYIMSIAAYALYMLFMPLNTSDRVIGAAVMVFFLLLRFMNDTIAQKLSAVKALSEELAAARRRIVNSEAYIRSLGEASSLKERSRFAVRIHDKLGHSISGSIILLEAAKLNIQSDPKQAEGCIDTAISALRSGVDDIRMSLRQERPDSTAVGAAELRAQLDRFTVDYDIKTDYELVGAEEEISPAVMQCIMDNMLEAMTNTVKHSNAQKFSLNIKVMNKVVTAEVKDDGRAVGVFAKGMGLTAIEERTRRAGGRCVISSREDGFHIVMIFDGEAKEGKYEYHNS